MSPEKGKSLGTGGIRGDSGFTRFPVDKIAVPTDEAEVGKIFLIVWAGQHANEMGGIFVRLMHLEREPGASLATGEGEGGVSSQSEGFGSNHGGGYTPSPIGLSN
jgi:hypothetical protein